MVFRVAFPNGTEARDPGRKGLLRPEADAKSNLGVSLGKLRHGVVGAAQDPSSQGEIPAVLAPDSLLREIVQNARLATGATGAFIGLVREHEIVCQATSGSNAGKFVSYLNRDHRIVDSCLRADSLQRCPDSYRSDELDANVCRYLGARSIVIIPNLSETRKNRWILGIFSSQPDAFSSAHVAALQNLNACIADAMAQAVRGTPVTPAEASAPAPSEPRKLVLIRGQLRFHRSPRVAMLRRSSIWISGIFAIALLGSWMLRHAISQWATLTWAKGPSAVTSQAVYVSPGHPSFAEVDTNPVKSDRFAGSVKPATDVAAAHETRKKPNRSQQKVPDLEIQNDLDDASSESWLISKSSDEPTTEAAPRESSTKAADPLSASAVLIPETVALDQVVERVKPDYPEDARAQHVQGTVVLDVVVGRDGQVETVSLVEGNARFLASAAEAVGRWRFAPLIRDGGAVRFKSHITLHFGLP